MFLMVSGRDSVIFIEEANLAGYYIDERCLAAEAMLRIMTSYDNQIYALGDQDGR